MYDEILQETLEDAELERLIERARAAGGDRFADLIEHLADYCSDQ